MNAPDPWAFGWTQLLTIIGFLITLGIAGFGFRSFGRWKREKLEEKKIDMALEVLAIAYETKYVFQAIRSPMSFEYEWEDMPENLAQTGEQRASRGAYYAILKRIGSHKDYFERAWRLHPKCTAIFGNRGDEAFLLMHRARRQIEVSAQMLSYRDLNPETRGQFERDIWDMGGFEPEKDEVGQKLRDFETRIEALCKPVIEKEFRPKRLWWWQRAPQ